MGIDRARLDRPGHRRALRPELPGDHHRRHGPRPGDAGRGAGHRDPVRRGRRLDGRHAGAAVGGGLPGEAVQRRLSSPRPPATRPRTSPSTRSGRQAIMADPDWRGGAYLQAGVRPGEGPGGRAHGRAHHLPVRGGPAAEVRPRAAARRPVVGLRRRLPGGELPAPPGDQLRRPLRRQQLPLHHPGAGLFRPGRASTAACWPRRSRGARDVQFCVLSLLLRLALSDAGEPRHRPRPERRRLPRPASPRSRPTRATTPSSSTSRCWTRRCAASSPPRPRRGASRERHPRGFRRDPEARAARRARARRRLREGELLELLTREKQRRRPGAGDQPAKASPPAWRAAWRSCRATATATSTTSRREAFDYAILSKTLQQMREPAARALRAAADRRPGGGLGPELRPLAGPLGAGHRAAACPRPAPCPSPGGRPPTSTSAPCATSPPSATRWTCASTPAPSLADGKPARPIDPRQPIENWRAETALFLLSRRAGPGRSLSGTDGAGAIYSADEASPDDLQRPPLRRRGPGPRRRAGGRR